MSVHVFVSYKDLFFVGLAVNEILGAAAKERSAESPSSTEDGKSSKGLSSLKIHGGTTRVYIDIGLLHIYENLMFCFSHCHFLFPVSSFSSAKVTD